MRTSCSTASVPGGVTGIGPPLLGLRGPLEPAQAGGEHVGEEGVQVREALGPDAVEPARAGAALADQAGLAQHLEVLGDRGLGDVEPRGDLAGAQLAGAQHPQDLAALGLGEGLEDLHRAYLSVNLYKWS